MMMISGNKKKEQRNYREAILVFVWLLVLKPLKE